MSYKQYKKIESVSNTATLVSGNSGEPVKQHKKKLTSTFRLPCGVSCDTGSYM